MKWEDPSVTPRAYRAGSVYARFLPDHTRHGNDWIAESGETFTLGQLRDAIAGPDGTWDHYEMNEPTYTPGLDDSHE